MLARSSAKARLRMKLARYTQFDLFKNAAYHLCQPNQTLPLPDNISDIYEPDETDYRYAEIPGKR
jgi:hypothetical protein